MLIAAAAALAAAGTAAAVGDLAPVVQLMGAGKVRGVGTASGGAYFLSLPFAAAPVKEKRWLPPLPVPPWPGTMDVMAFKPACAQGADWTGQPEPSIPGGGQGSEDCLYLDVYTPSLQATRGPLAVVLFVHGGVFTGGDSAGGKIGPGGPLPGVPFSTRFNGTFMAEAQQVVVVSVNYRLGIFGFLGSQQLAAHAASALLGKPMGTGNYGIQDQRAAMAWVAKHIAAFGGDPSRVMIHGCSAGGVSIANHMTQPLSWPYFSSAAMESGNQLTFTDAVSMADAQASYEGLLSGLGCSSLDCLLALNTSQLLNAPTHLHSAPVVDGVNLHNFPRRLLRAGRVKRVPTIVGSARDEVAGLMADTLLQYANMTADGFRQWIASNYGPQHVQRMEELYPPSSARVGAEGGDCAGATKGSKGCSLWYYLVGE